MSTKTPGDTETGMPREEWIRRYKERLIDEYGFNDDSADMAFDAVDFDEIVDGFEEDPEAAADEEMSYAD